MDWMILPLRRYAEFSGRSRRREYWMFMLLQILGLLLLGMLASILPGDPTTFVVAISAVAILALLLPNITVTVRRLHDRNLSGWWILLSLIPYLGSLIVIVLMLLPGTPGPNRFGADPKAQA